MQVIEINGPQMNVPAFSKEHGMQVLIITIPDEKESHYDDFFGQGETVIRRVDL